MAPWCGAPLLTRLGGPAPKTLNFHLVPLVADVGYFRIAPQLVGEEGITSRLLSSECAFPLSSELEGTNVRVARAAFIPVTLQRNRHHGPVKSSPFLPPHPRELLHTQVPG